MFKKFTQIREEIKNATLPGIGQNPTQKKKKVLVPGSSPAEKAQKLRKVPGTPRKFPPIPVARNGVKTGPSMEEDGGVAMSAGTGGFSNSADAKGPVAGFDVPMGKKKLSMIRRKTPVL